MSRLVVIGGALGIGVFGAMGGVIAGAVLLLGQPVKAGAASFSCSISNGAPATMVQTTDGRSVPMIRWTSNTFDGAGWSPTRRCQEVSQRFETFRQQGRLNYLTTGRMNGQPVICTARQTGAPCDGLLYTLKPGQDPTTALTRLLDVRFKARGPLNETQERLYINVEELVNAGGSLSGSATVETPSPVPQAGSGTKPLW
jgi:hypothetical protein